MKSLNHQHRGKIQITPKPPWFGVQISISNGILAAGGFSSFLAARFPRAMTGAGCSELIFVPFFCSAELTLPHLAQNEKMNFGVYTESRPC